MIRQKVITVNIALNSFPDNRSSIHEIELTELNKNLDAGYVVVDKFSTVSNATGLFVINLTFILQKEDGK